MAWLRTSGTTARCRCGVVHYRTCVSCVYSLPAAPSLATMCPRPFQLQPGPSHAMGSSAPTATCKGVPPRRLRHASASAPVDLNCCRKPPAAAKQRQTTPEPS